jgi:class 3 adenylate cyclase
VLGSGIDLAGQRRDIATLFTDIANFTALVETLEPGVLGPLLNEYLTGMTDIVFAHDGTVAKIVGDALHVLFGAPGEQPDHAARAVACALELDDYAQSFRERCEQKGIALGVTRIGVHAGPAIVGNFGGGRFFDYTAYGDTINIAARLEAANKQLGTRICVSAILAAKVKDFRWHDLRHTFASTAVAAGQGLSMIGKLLGHTQVQTTARYAHLAADPIKLAANHVSAEIAILLNERTASGRATDQSTDTGNCSWVEAVTIKP